jgi:hypothetical protein
VRAKVRKTNLRHNFQHAKNDTIFSEIISKHFRAHVSASHFPWDLQCEIVRAKVPSENLPAKFQHTKNETIFSDIFIKHFKYPFLPGPKLPCTVQPFTPTVPRGFPEGLLCGTLGGEEQRCMGAVRHPSLTQCLTQLPPGVLRRTLGRVAVDTANSMMNERSRAHHTCVDTTRSVALLTQQYGTTGWRSMRAVRLCASHPDHSLRDPSSVDIRWSQFLQEPRLMDTEGSLGLCGWKAGAAPAPGRHSRACRALAVLLSGPMGRQLLCEQGWNRLGPHITVRKSPSHHPRCDVWP